MDVVGLTLLMISFATTCAYVAECKGLEHRRWLVLGALLGFVALFIVLVQPSRLPSTGDA